MFSFKIKVFSWLSLPLQRNFSDIHGKFISIFPKKSRCFLFKDFYVCSMNGVMIRALLYPPFMYLKETLQKSFRWMKIQIHFVFFSNQFSVYFSDMQTHDMDKHFMLTQQNTKIIDLIFTIRVRIHLFISFLS